MPSAIPGLAILRLELSRLARRERTYWLRTLYVSTLATAVGIAWLARDSSGATWTGRELAGQFIFGVFAILQFFLLGSAAAVSLSGAITDEKNGRTLPLLFSSSLSGMDIMLGKLLGRLLPIVLMLITGIPIMFLMLMFGGISGKLIIMVLIMSLIYAIVCGASALFFSCVTRQPQNACGLGMLLVVAVFHTGVMPDYLNVYSVFRHALPPEHGLPGWLGLCRVVVVGLFMTWCLLAGGAVVLRGMVRDASLVSVVNALPLRFRFFRRGPRPLPRAPGTGNPVYAREAGTWRDLARHWIMVPGQMFLFMVLAAWLCRDYLLPRVRQSAAAGHFWFIPLLLAILCWQPLMATAGSFARAWSGGVFTLLFTTGLSRREIMRGKVGGLLLRSMPLLLLPICYGLYFAARGALPWWAGLVMAVELAVYGFFLVAITAWAGFICRRAPRIIGLSLLLAAGVDLFLALLWFAGQLVGITGSFLHAFPAWWVVAGWGEILVPGTPGHVQLMRDLVINLSVHLLVAALIIGYGRDE